MTKKLSIGLVFGGRSGEHEVSIASAISVYNALDKSRYDVTLIAIDKEGHWRLPSEKQFLTQAANPLNGKIVSSAASYAFVPCPGKEQLISLEAGQTQVPHLDVVMGILHGTFGEDGTIQGMLEMAQIPYVGSGVLGSAIGMDKEIARKLLRAAGIPTVPTLCIRKSAFLKNPASFESQILRDFIFPFFVKPANAGSSVGVHKVKTREQLRAALDDAFDFDVKVLVEKGINARELECAVLGNDEPRASIVGEIVPRHEFYSYEAKYLDDNGADLHIPAQNLKPELAEKVRAMAIETFRVLQCRGMARVDFFLDRDDGALYLNEVNTIPGFTKISMYPKLWEASGIGYSALVDELIRLALENSAEKKALKTNFR